MQHVLTSLVILVGYMASINAENILVVMPIPARSHFKSFQPLFEELIKRGFNLTIISGEKLSENLQRNYTHIDVRHLSSKMAINFAEMRRQSRLENFIFSNERIIEYDEWVLQEPRIQQLLTSKDDKFDLVIIELFHLDVYVAFGYHFKAPVVALSAQTMISSYSWISGNPIMPSYIPNLYLPLTDNMSFFERLVNTAFTMAIGLYHELISLPKHQMQMETYFPFEDRKNIPSIKDMMKNISLILANYHFTFGYPKPSLPNVIHTAGLHITEAIPLPENMQNFMNEATNGAIYVSLGSLIQPNDMKAMGNTFVNALKNLPQRIIFKWNPKLLPTIPDNFLVQEWVPQSSILKHPNCHLFVTHGGLHSLLESINYSVPVVGVPFFTDQQHNIALIEYLGIGKGLNSDFNRNELLSAVEEVSSDSRYRENVKRQSEKFNDRIVSPLNTAVYWVQYVLRHKDGLDQLKPASMELSWYQYLLLDVMIAIFLMISSTVLIFYLAIKFLYFRFMSAFSLGKKLKGQ